MVRRRSSSPTDRDTDPDSLSVLDAALYWAERGVSVFPCLDKRPMKGTQGFKDAVNSKEDVIKLFGAHPTATMVGGSMGTPSSMFAIDLDLYKGPEVEAWMQNLIDNGMLPETRIHKSPRNGIHIFFNGTEMPRSSYPMDGVEVRGNGAYVIMPGGGTGYKVMSSAIVSAPKTLLKFLASIKTTQSVESPDTLKARILSGENMHDSISRLAARYAAMGWTQEQITASIMDTMRASMTSDPGHPRYARWKFLMDNEGGEFMRAITTAHSKYSSAAARDQYESVVDDTLRASMAAAAAAVFAPPPTGRETESAAPVKAAADYDGEWPWSAENDGYFAHHNHDLLSQRFVMYPLLCEDESILIASEPKAGKTAIALTLGLHVAVGRNLGPSLRVAEPRGVLYFGLEGRRAIRLRIEAWRRHQLELGEVLPDFIPFFVVERSTNLLQEDARIELAEKVLAAEIWMKQQHNVDLGAVFFDTLTKAMPGGDQNSVEDTSAVFDVVSRLRDKGCKAAAGFIHHKSRAGNIRGSTNIEADPDVLMSVSKAGDVVTLTLDRARSIEEGGNYSFKLLNFELGTSEQGFAIRAPVAEILDMAAPTAEGMDAAFKESPVLALIVSLMPGIHPLEMVHDILHEAGLAPVPLQVGRVKNSKLRWDSAAAQVFYNDLIPDTGRVFAGRSVEKVRKDGKIVSIHIR